MCSCVSCRDACAGFEKESARATTCGCLDDVYVYVQGGGERRGCERRLAGANAGSPTVAQLTGMGDECDGKRGREWDETMFIYAALIDIYPIGVEREAACRV